MSCGKIKRNAVVKVGDLFVMLHIDNKIFELQKKMLEILIFPLYVLLSHSYCIILGVISSFLIIF